MIVGTTEAANLLGVSTARVRQLLNEGRIQGAYKIGKCWAIPLFNGMPAIARGRRGPKPRWRSRKHLPVTLIHVNRNAISHNRKKGDRAPVISVKRGKSNVYGHQVNIHGPCRIVYRPERPKSCGATVWIETLFQVQVS